MVGAPGPGYRRAMSVAVPQPSPSKLALAVRATRPPYLPTSVLPALAGALVAIGHDAADWWLLPLVLVATLLVHAGVDITNEVEDAANGVDSPDKMDNSRVFSAGLLSIAEGRRIYAAVFAGRARARPGPVRRCRRGRCCPTAWRASSAAGSTPAARGPTSTTGSATR